MDARAELWAQYKAKLEEAKALDRLEGTLVFLAQPALIGRFYVAPITLERLLWLEAIESPFAGGKDELTRKHVLNALWLLSPHFKPGKWRRRLFCTGNHFLGWLWYAEHLAEHLAEGIELVENSWQEAGKVSASDPLWVASIIDGLAHQYGWGLRDIMRLPLVQLGRLSQALGTRLSEDKKRGGGRHSDAAKQDYLKRQTLSDRANLNDLM